MGRSQSPGQTLMASALVLILCAPLLAQDKDKEQKRDSHRDVAEGGAGKIESLVAVGGAIALMFGVICRG